LADAESEALVPALAPDFVESELEQPVVVRMVPETNPAIAAETINVLAVLVIVIIFLAFFFDISSFTFDERSR
jgi:hypothetical protein